MKLEIVLISSSALPVFKLIPENETEIALAYAIMTMKPHYILEKAGAPAPLRSDADGGKHAFALGRTKNGNTRHRGTEFGLLI